MLYEYQPTREGEHPQKFLAGFRGYLNVDGYAGYHAVEGVTLVGCWVHDPSSMIIREDEVKGYHPCRVFVISLE